MEIDEAAYERIESALGPAGVFEASVLVGYWRLLGSRLRSSAGPQREGLRSCAGLNQPAYGGQPAVRPLPVKARWHPLMNESRLPPVDHRSRDQLAYGCRLPESAGGPFRADVVA